MGLITKIQWCDHTFNPWRGCTKVAAGCANCYAEKLSRRNPNVLGIWGDHGTRVVASEAMWREPLKWNRSANCQCGSAGLGDRECEWCANGCRRPRVFCASLCDVFEEWDGGIVDSKSRRLFTINGDEWFGESEYPECRNAMLDDVRRRLFRLIDETPNLDWLLLTKRPENIPAMWCSHVNTDGKPPSQLHRDNCWLGTSIAVQEDVDRNWPLLADCRDLARVLFLSIEPLVGPVDLSWMRNKMKPDWVIVGGESGPKARPCNAAWWIRDIVEQCQQALVPCFVKQLGSHTVWNDSGFVTHMILNDKKGGDPDEWPGYLRVREFPRGGGK